MPTPSLTATLLTDFASSTQAGFLGSSGRQLKTLFHFILFSCLDIFYLNLCELCLVEPSCCSDLTHFLHMLCSSGLWILLGIWQVQSGSWIIRLEQRSASFRQMARKTSHLPNYSLVTWECFRSKINLKIAKISLIFEDIEVLEAWCYRRREKGFQFPCCLLLHSSFPALHRHFSQRLCVKMWSAVMQIYKMIFGQILCLVKKLHLPCWCWSSLES